MFLVDFDKLIDLIVDAEIEDAGNQKLKKMYWLESAQQLETQGIIKEKVSAHLHKLIESKMNEKSDIKLKFENRYYYEVMSAAGYTNQKYNRTGSRDTSPKIISDREYPDGTHYELLDRMKIVSQNNIRLINKVIDKLTFDPDKILKDKPDLSFDDRQLILDEAKSKIEKRRRKFEDSISHTTISHKDITMVLKNQETALQLFDGRVSVTTWNKVMITFLMDLGYDKLDIANALEITTKHIKSNIASPEHKNRTHRLIREVINRCPNPDCGVELMDYIEKRVQDHNKGHDIDDDDFDPEPLKLTGYQKKYIELKEKQR